MTGSSAYEIWVMTMRRWARDPSTDTSGLPSLAADSLPPEAYSRLLRHIIDAIEEMMREFSDRLAKGISGAHSEHDMARVLVGLRAHLARRVLLVRHPSLPAEIQRPLMEGTARDITKLQSDLENAMTASSDRYGSDRAHGERMLKLVRDNRFTAILDPGFPLHSLFTPTGGFAAAASSPVPNAADHRAPTASDRRAHAVPGPIQTGPIRRRVVIDTEGQL